MCVSPLVSRYIHFSFTHIHFSGMQLRILSSRFLSLLRIRMMCTPDNGCCSIQRQRGMFAHESPLPFHHPFFINTTFAFLSDRVSGFVAGEFPVRPAGLGGLGSCGDCGLGSLVEGGRRVLRGLTGGAQISRSLARLLSLSLLLHRGGEVACMSWTRHCGMRYAHAHMNTC